MSRIVRRVAASPLDGARRAPGRRSNFSPRRAVASILQVKRPPEDQWILLPALLLVGLGVLMVFSSSALNSLISTDDAYVMGTRQLIFAVMGIGALAILSNIDYRRWRPFATPAFFVSLVLLFLVLMPWVPTEQGLKRSLSVGPISIHAAEIAKLALILCLANFFANRGHLMAQRETLYPALAAIGLTFLLVLIAPDLGTATVIAGIGFALFFTAGAPLRWVFGTALMAAAVSVIGISFRSYQAARLNNWMDPFSDPTGGSYQTLQGLIAIATGGLFGTGIGTSQQPGGVIIPYAWNDYIFAVVGEEFGFLGAVVVIGAFIAIALRGLRVARRAPDTFGALLATGIVVWICGQAFLNIGVVLAILPVTGIPLPLLSQGGSSLFVLMCAIGLLLSVSRETMGAQEIGGIHARGDRGRRYGGHLFPGLAVARTLQRQQPDVEIHWLGGQRGIEREIIPTEGYPLTLLAAPSLRVSAAGPLANLRDALALARSIPQAIRYLRRVRPDVLFSTGGYIAIPALLAAAVTRTPSLIWEGNVQAGRSNRLVAPLASARAIAWPSTADQAPWNRPNTYVTGTPVRSFEGRDRSAARGRLGILPDFPLLLVFGGSQRVLRFEGALAGSLSELLGQWQVLHVAADGLDRAEAIRSALPEALQSRYTPVRFLQGGAMEDALISADLLLGRAGASTIAEAAALGLPSIIVPYPYAGGHQHANARELAAVGGAIVIDDAALTPELLQREVARMSVDSVRQRIGAAAASLARPGSAKEIAKILLRLGRHG